MSYIVMGFTILLLFICLMIKGYYDDKKYIKLCVEKANQSFGKKSTREYSKNELANIKHYFEVFKSENSIDEITINDLNIDEIYKAFNVSLSNPGDEVFYKNLCTPIYDQNYLDELYDKSDYILKNDKIRESLQAYFLTIGRLKGISFVEFIDLIGNISIRKPFKEVVLFLLLALSIGLIFVDTSIGIFLLISFFVINILDYYKERGKIENYIVGFSYATNLIEKSLNIVSIEDKVIEDNINDIYSIAIELKSIKRFSGLIISRNKNVGAGNPLDILTDYLRMFFHLDILAFYRSVSFLQSKKEDICILYEKLGELEFLLNVASIKKCYKDYTKPVKSEYSVLKGINNYHPLIENPVKNDFDQKGGFLITGSNASGKSTFLRTVALNILFAQTINLAFADYFELGDLKLMTSLSITDNLLNGESYFIAEIKSLKRIFDAISSKHKLCVFTDELLRGTNTIERIAAVSKILESLLNNKAFVFAATHDVELTDILADKYDNYHFDEEIADGDIIFNYKIKTGKASSKNAIKLLSILGFNDELVLSAQKMADYFTNNGIWKE